MRGQQWYINFCDKKNQQSACKADSPPRIRTLGLDAIVYGIRFRCHKARFSSGIPQCIDTDSDNDKHCSINIFKMKGFCERA